MNANIPGVLSEINSDSTGIASCNSQIAAIEAGGGDPDALLDERDGLLSSLSNDVNVQYNENANGQISVFLQNGQALVEGDNSWNLNAVDNPSNSNYSDITLEGSTGNCEWRHHQRAARGSSPGARYGRTQVQLQPRRDCRKSHQQSELPVSTRL